MYSAITRQVEEELIPCLRYTVFLQKIVSKISIRVRRQYTVTPTFFLASNFFASMSWGEKKPVVHFKIATNVS